MFLGYMTGNLLAAGYGEHISSVVYGAVADALVIFLLIAPDNPLLQKVSAHLLGPLVCALTFAMCRMGQGLLHRILCSKLMQALVPYTLALYLVHVPVILWYKVLIARNRTCQTWASMSLCFLDGHQHWGTAQLTMSAVLAAIALQEMINASQRWIMHSLGRIASVQ